MATLTGVSAMPEVVAGPVEGGPFVLPDSPLTRQQDRAARILGTTGTRQEDGQSNEEPSGSSGPDSTQPALGLSKAFDSFDATMRLAALTGMEKELDEFSETQKIARLKALSQAKRAASPTATTSPLSASTTWQRSGSLTRSVGSGGQSAAVNLKLVWIGSALLALAAAALFLLR